jgi:hypothetical protein
MGRDLPRGFANLVAIDKTATIDVRGQVVLARHLFQQIEVEQRLMNRQERAILLQCLNPLALERYPLEMPFRVPPNVAIDQSCVEVFYGPNRYLVYCEFIDDVGLQRLVRHQQIPCDDTNPTQHITLLLANTKSQLQ